MVDDPGELIEPGAPAPPRLRRRWRLAGWLAAILALLLALAWFNRAAIVEWVISGQMARLGIPGRYKIESAGIGTQVLTGIVIGDPARPDLTVERAEITIVPTFGLPTVGRLTLVRPRLYGTVTRAGASFGALDRLLFAKAKKPAGLPDMDLVLIDGRARLDTAFGPVGIKAEGRGNLSGGFTGIVGAAASRLDLGQCAASQASLYGTISVAAGRPRFSGPLRAAALDCAGPGVKLSDLAARIDVGAAGRLAGDPLAAAEGKFAATLGSAAWRGTASAGAHGSGDFTFANGDLTLRYRVGAGRIAGAYGSAETIGLEGLLRTRQSFARIEGDGTLSGTGLAAGPALTRALREMADSGRDTLAGPLAARLGEGLAREGRGSRLEASFMLRGAGETRSLTLARAALVGGSGQQVLALSRFQLALGPGGAPRLAGNFVTGGAGLPRIQGRIGDDGEGRMRARLTMEEYRAGGSALSLPVLNLIESRPGEYGFSGQAALSGALPGGEVEALELPLEGSWSARAGLAAWHRCTPLTIRRLSAGSLALDASRLTLCPDGQGAIVSTAGGHLRVAASARQIDLSGVLGTERVHITAAAVRAGWPALLDAQGLAVVIGGDEAAGTNGEPVAVLRFARLQTAKGVGGGGTFSGGEARLGAVPLDILAASGNWRLADGRLAVSDGAFRLEDRARDDRFRPLVASGAGLVLADGKLSADAVLREPDSGREVLEAKIEHDLASTSGHAVLDVPGLVFDGQMQPDTLSALALGVIANAKGTVRGSGRIDWNGQNVTSTGSFSTSGLDFAAAFGPTRGVSGTVEFSDLLGLVTKPDQRLRIAAINPGIEVASGEVSFQLEGNNVLVVNGAHWPFIDGTLELLPTRMVLGAAEVRRYTLRLRGANAAKFVQQLDLGNLSASGVFDGDIPIVFDQDGGHVVGGLLISRKPGGNISYVGALTYKDLTPMANFAFQSLRSLDFKRMEVGLDGNLDGEIVTRIRFDGVSQGAGARKNIATRALKGLPIQFNVNIRAPFQKLITSFKSTYDPSYIADPRALGIVGKDGKPVPRPGQAPAPAAPPPPAAAPAASPKGGLTGEDKDIQPSVSRNRR